MLQEEIVGYTRFSGDVVSSGRAEEKGALVIVILQGKNSMADVSHSLSPPYMRMRSCARSGQATLNKSDVARAVAADGRFPVKAVADNPWCGPLEPGRSTEGQDEAAPTLP